MLCAMRAVVEGLLAGWAIAVPVGAIGVLIVDRAATRGWMIGAAAATGTAVADGFYAVVAVLVGAAVTNVLPDAAVTQTISALVLAAVGLWLLWRATRRTGSPQVAVSGPAATAAMFFGLTVVNPVTVVYFAALVASLNTSILPTMSHRVLFAGAAFAASLSWQLLLAGFGAVVGNRLSERAAKGLRVLGALLVLAFALRAGLQALS